ncbi:MAG: D-alanyl-D-alanine carboxypeptidase [Eubacterium sp.]|nr:D-alanyl-D-alanine carboxypeptidase [Eubacterium sp.]
MKKIISFFTALTLLLYIPVAALAEENKDFESLIEAKSAVLMCLDTGDVIYAKNEKEHLSPASVTKIMTILLVLEAIDNHQISLQDKVKASQEAVKMGGSQIWLEVGEVMTVDELLKAVIIASANDACTALGEYVGGTSAGFVKMMNDRAKSLGCNDTNFENCNGLDDTASNHYSCSYDLALISREVMKHKLVENYTTIWLDSLRNGTTELNNTNKMINSYEGITGLKTGTTSNAGFCISATARRENMNLVAVVLGSETSEKRFETASLLLEKGFTEYELIKPNIDTNKIKSVKVAGGVFKEVTPKPIHNDSFLVKKGNGNEIKYKYIITSKVTAPVSKGDTLGKITMKNGDSKIGEIKLVSPNDISKISLKSIFVSIIENI